VIVNNIWAMSSAFCLKVAQYWIYVLILEMAQNFCSYLGINLNSPKI